MNLFTGSQHRHPQHLMSIRCLQNSEHKRERKVLPIKELDGGQGAWTLSLFKVTQAMGTA